MSKDSAFQRSLILSLSVRIITTIIEAVVPEGPAIAMPGPSARVDRCLTYDLLNRQRNDTYNSSVSRQSSNLLQPISVVHVSMSWKTKTTNPSYYLIVHKYLIILLAARNLARLSGCTSISWSQGGIYPFGRLRGGPAVHARGV